MVVSNLFKKIESFKSRARNCDYCSNGEIEYLSHPDGLSTIVSSASLHMQNQVTIRLNSQGVVIVIKLLVKYGVNDMNQSISGGCLCGEVTFTVENSFKRFLFCHCQQCRKITGSAHASNLFTKPEAFEWTSGETSKKQFNFPGRDFTAVFCTECGSSLPFVTKNGKTLIVPAGSLDEEPKITPNVNIFWAERASWYDLGIAAQHCTGFPE